MLLCSCWCSWFISRLIEWLNGLDWCFCVRLSNWLCVSMCCGLLRNMCSSWYLVLFSVISVFLVLSRWCLVVLSCYLLNVSSVVVFVICMLGGSMCVWCSIE